MWGLSIEMRHFRWQSIHEILWANIWKNAWDYNRGTIKQSQSVTLLWIRDAPNLICMISTRLIFLWWGRPFYRRPFGDRNHVSESNSLVNKLGTIIKTMYTESGFVGNYSNHSGKLTCRTTLFQSGKLHVVRVNLLGGGDKLICFVLYWYIHVDVFSLEFEEQWFWKERGILN